ncbi:MAG: PRC-barrel domain-containing protein [Mucilaginibacter sp.]
MATQEKVAQLEELRKSGFEIADGQPDITNWDIRTRSGKKAGDVDDLLFDPDTGKVRYIIADLDSNELDLADDRKVLIPIGLAELYTKGEHLHRRQRIDPAFSAYDPSDHGNLVYVPSISAQQLDSLPLYEKGRLSRHTEIAIRKILEPTDNSEREEDEFYKHGHFNDDRFYDRNK